MSARCNDQNPAPLNRREFLGAFSLTVAALLSGCSTLRLLFHTYPDRFDTDAELRRRLLTAFVRTVIPEARADEPHLTEIFGDRFYPFAEYCGFFLADLSATARKLHGTGELWLLDLASRTAVVTHGLDRRGPTGRLYASAVFMAEFSYYGGIYDDDRGCPLIDFTGANGGRAPNNMTAGEIESHLAPSLTPDGNPG